MPTPPGPLAGRSPFIGPARFLPNPTNLTRANGAPCTPSSAGYPAAWASGMAQEPGGSSRLLITGCDAASGLNLCRALTGHPEISTTTALLMSYFNPASSHVGVVGIAW